MTLIAFDVDGTLLTKEMEGMGQYVEGIIPTSILINLEKQGYIITIVSPSPYLPKIYQNDEHWFCRNGSNDYRWSNIVDAQKFYGITKDDTIYIDDLEGNHKNVKNYVKLSYFPQEFLDDIKSYIP